MKWLLKMTRLGLAAYSLNFCFCQNKTFKKLDNTKSNLEACSRVWECDVRRVGFFPMCNIVPTCNK